MILFISSGERPCTSLLPSPSLPLPVDVTAGDSTTLICSPHNVHPEAEIRWSGAEKASRVINATKLVVTPTWEENGAKITCTGSNPYYGVSLRSEGRTRMCIGPMRALTHSFHELVHSFIHSFIHSYVHPFLHSFIHSSIHTLIQ